MGIRRFLFLLVLVSVFTTASADNWLILKLKNGAQQGFQIPGKMTVRTEGESLLLASDKVGEVAFPLSNLSGYYFADDVALEMGIDEITSEHIRISSMDESKVVLEGVPEHSAVKLYGINGVEYPVSISRTGDNTTISLSTLPAGVFIINIPNIASIKINH